MFKVLWFDDEFKTLELIKENALLNDIELLGFDNARDGIDELKKNHSKYDAVILDGVFFRNAYESGNPDSSLAFGDVAKELFKLKSAGVYLPWFTYSGQASFTKDKNEVWEILKDSDYADGKIFDKNEDDDLEDLCSEIKKAVAEKIETRIRKENEEAFKAISYGFIDREDLLLKILIRNENGDYKKENFQTQRDFLEAVYLCLINPVGCIPSDFINRNDLPNLSWCTRYMENRPTETPPDSGITHQLAYKVPRTVQTAFRGLYETTSKYSHLSDEKVITRTYRINTEYVLAILEWLPKFVYDNYMKDL